MAYRDSIKAHNAIGRHINVVWYEPVDGSDDEIDVEGDMGPDELLLVPSGGKMASLPIVGMSLAEISLTSGFYPEVLADDDDRTVELKHEARFLQQEVQTFESRKARLAGMLSIDLSWARIVKVSTAVDFEVFAFQHRSLADLTKMALARALQTRDGLSDVARNRAWQLEKHTLIYALEHGSLLPAPKAKAKAKAKVGPKAKPKPKPKPKLVAAGPAAPAPLAPGAGRGIGRAAAGRMPGGKGRGRGSSGSG